MARVNKLLLNTTDDCVDEMLDGIVQQNPGVCRLQGHRVVIREDAVDHCQANRVSLICGGGSGHEPFAAGFVGKGMLTAAVAGSVFTSPPSNDILAAIKAVNSTAGILLIVANYTGDRLNFGIALERARAIGCKVDMVVVGEDCALESCDKTAGRRGLVGIVNVMKIAGALAEQGKSLDSIVKMATSAACSMGTIGVSLTGCSIPGRGSSFMLAGDEMELGLGAHGEAGVKRLKVKSAADTVRIMIDHMTNHKHSAPLKVSPNDRVAVMLNNLGGLSVLEMHVIGREVISVLQLVKQVKVERFYFGHLMTSLDMCGFNMNILKLDSAGQIEKCLDEPTDAVGWPRVGFSSIFKHQRTDKKPIAVSHVTAQVADGASTQPAQHLNSNYVQAEALQCIEVACKSLVESEGYINELDTAAGDGDCGSTMKRGATSILAALPLWKGLLLSEVFLEIAACAETNMGGASGGLYSLFFTAASRSVVGLSNQWVACLESGIGAICKYGGAEPGDRTMVDALIAAKQAVCDGATAESVAQATRLAAEQTCHMKAKAGRASYVSSTQLTKPDAGAIAVAIIFESVARGLNK